MMENLGDCGFDPCLGRSPGEGHGNAFQYSCLESPMDRETWWATVHRVAKGRTGLKQLSTHACSLVKARETVSKKEGDNLHWLKFFLSLKGLSKGRPKGKQK